MATYNPFLDPDFVSNTARPKLSGTVQAAPQPQQPQTPSLPSGVGEFLASYGKAVENMGLAGPGHGRNQNIADRAVIEREAAFQQRAAFNEAFPRGRGADGLVEVPKIDQALANRAYAARRAGGDPRRPVGDNNLKINQEQTGFQMLPGKTPDGAQRRVSTWAPPLSLGGVLAPSYQAPTYTGRGGDFRDPKTGAVSGLIDYQAPDGVKYTDANVWTVAPIPESDQRGPGIYDSNFMPPAKLAEMQHVRDRATGKQGGPIGPPMTRFTPVAAGGAKAPPVAGDPEAAAITAMLDREVAQSRAREMAEIQAAFQPLPAPATAPATVGDAITSPPAEVPPAAPAAPAAGPRPFETPEAVQARLMLEEQARQDQLAEQAKKQQEAKRRAEEQVRLAKQRQVEADQRALELSRRKGNTQQEPWRPGAQRGNPNQ